MLENLHTLYATAKAVANTHPDKIHYTVTTLKWLGKNCISILTGLQKLREYYQAQQVPTASNPQPQKIAEKPANGFNEAHQRPAA